MDLTYQTSMEQAKTSAKKGISLTELFQQDEIVQNYTKTKRILNMTDIIDRPIRIIDYEIYEGTNNFGKEGEFVKFVYYLDGDDENVHETTSQASGIKSRLRAIPKEVIEENGGILTMIEQKKTPNGNSYQFAGV